MAIVTYIEAAERKHPTENATFSFRPLSGGELDEANAAMLRELANRYDGEVLGTMKGLKDIEDEEREKQEAKSERPAPFTPTDPDDEPEDESDPLRPYSATIVVKYGLTAWRGDGPPGQPAYDNIPCTNDTKAALDKATREWAAREIIALSVVPEGKSPSSAGGSGNDAPNGASRGTPSLTPSPSSEAAVALP